MLANPANLWLICTDLGAGNGYGTKMSPRDPNVPHVKSQRHIIDPTNPCGALHNGIEDWLHVRGGPADDAEHFGRCGLMFKGLAQFGIALLQFFEQSYVLDGDDRLVGKSLQERDLFIRERPHLRAADKDHPDRDPGTRQWGCQRSSNTVRTSVLCVRKFNLRLQKIMHMNRF